MPESVAINEHLSIPRSELQFRFARSGGKGGQNVNKVETRVELLFDIAGSPSLTAEQRERLTARLRNRIDAAGVLRIVAQESRSQWKNREEAVRRFAALLQQALKERKKRKKTKPSHVARERRLEEKRRRGDVKKARRTHDF
jgi:ribosome-associated protein